MGRPKDLDTAIASLAVLKINDLRAKAGKVASKLGPDATTSLFKRLKEPTVPAEDAGLNPAFKFEWPWKWTATVIELLGGLGPAGAAVLWSLLDDPNDNIAQRAIVVLLRMPATVSGPKREELLAELRQKLPKFYRKDVPLYPIISSMLTEARTEANLLNVLSALSELVLLDAKKKKFVLGDMARDILHPPPPPPKPPELPEHKAFAEQFADAIVTRDLKGVHDMLSPGLGSKLTMKKLEAEFIEASSQCGWPVRHEAASFGGMRADELRGSRSKFEPSLPKSIKDEEFRNWMWIRFLPDEDSDSDFAFDLGVALVDSAGKLKVGYYWATAED